MKFLERGSSLGPLPESNRPDNPVLSPKESTSFVLNPSSHSLARRFPLAVRVFLGGVAAFGSVALEKASAQPYDSPSFPRSSYSDVVSDTVINHSALSEGFMVAAGDGSTTNTSKDVEEWGYTGEGFRAIAMNLPLEIVGKAIGPETPLANGDVMQLTENGAMFWRKKDNWTAFTDGSRTWVNGPLGLQERGNDEMFEWEWEEQKPAEVAGVQATPAPVKEREFYPGYTQSLDAKGILIKAPASVNPKALESMQAIAARMLAYRPDIRQKMVEKNYQIIIIPRSVKLTDLPEFSSLKQDEAKWGSVRGIGAGVTAGGRPMAIGEEKLMGQDLTLGVAAHEVAHDMQTFGFTEEENAEWKKLYEKYKAKGIFGSSYAILKKGEFWAVLSQIFTGETTDQVYAKASTNGLIGTAVDILKVAPDAYVFLGSFYGSGGGK